MHMLNVECGSAMKLSSANTPANVTPHGLYANNIIVTLSQVPRFGTLKIMFF